MEYFGILEYLKNSRFKVGNSIVINSKTFYTFLDHNMYIKRIEKLEVYKKLNFIRCNSKGYTSVLYDKETKKAKRMIIINLDTYELIKNLYETKIEL